MIRLAIIADRKAAANDIADLLAFEDRIDVVEASSAAAVPYRVASTADVLLAVKVLAAQLPPAGLPIVVLSEDPGSPPAGVHAWLPLESSPQVIIAAIIAAAAGLYTFTADQLHFSPLDNVQQAPAEKLTARELQVLNLMSEGLGNKQIAAQLDISTHTAKFHVAQVLAKLRAGTRTEAVRIGIRRGLVAL